MGHSLSPRIQEEALRVSGLEGECRAVEADEDILESFLDDLRAGRLHGFNVTMPLKLAARERCDLLTAEALDSGSVNTVRLREGRVEGHSSDVMAFRQAWAQFPQVEQILVLGAGGSARAALAAWGRGKARVSGRRQDRALTLAEEMGVGVARWGEAVPGALVVNATPLGMRGEALPPAVVEAAAGLVDLPYGGGTTPAVSTATRLGVHAVDGIEFLARQAAASFEWWTGVPVDSEHLVSVARNG